MVKETNARVALIKKNLKTVQGKQKSYVDNCKIDLELKVGDHVFLKVSLLKGIMRFGKKEKLSPCFIGLFKILARMRFSMYQLTLPHELTKVHNSKFLCYANTNRAYRMCCTTRNSQLKKTSLTKKC